MFDMAVAVERTTVRRHIDRHRLRWQRLKATNDLDDDTLVRHVDLKRNDLRERRHEHLRMRECDGLQIIMQAVIASTTCAVRRAQERLLQQESRHRRAGWPALWVSLVALFELRALVRHFPARAASDPVHLPRLRARATCLLYTSDAADER